MIRRILRLKENTLHIPIRTGARKTTMQIWLGERLLYDFSIELSEGEPQFYTFLDLRAVAGLEISIVLPDSAGYADTVLDRIVNAGEPDATNPLYPGLYQEKLRPKFHFSSRRGWLNDPNGLLYCDGQYHLYYQHNPFGTLHSGVNVSWGHAVSTDLFHWREKPDAIMPWRRDWLIASGSAMLDEENLAGYGKNAIIAAFTCLGTVDEHGHDYPAGGQFLAASLDGGDTFIRFSHKATVGAEHGASWRDPRIFRHGDHIVMAAYECHNGVNGVSFYKSTDFHDWKLTSWAADLYECPDLFQLPVEEGAGSKWVLYGGDGMARVGEFQNGSFNDESLSYPLDYGTSTYAGQTWNHEPKGRRVHISWIRGIASSTQWDGDMGYDGMPFSQCMSTPCTLSLREEDGKVALFRYPVEEISQLRQPCPEKLDFPFSGQAEVALKAGDDIDCAIHAQSETIEFEVAGHSIRYEADKALLTFDNGLCRALGHGPLKLRILVDTTTIELFFGGGIAATYALDTAGSSIVMKGDGEFRGDRWALSPIWQTGK